MAWTAEDRRKYAPAIQEVLRQGMLVRLAATIDTIDPPAKVGRPRDWSTVTVLGALWHLARDGVVQELVGTVGRRGFVVEPRRWKVEQTLGRLQRYRRLRVDDEMSNETSRHMTILASLFMTGMRFERMLRA